MSAALAVRGDAPQRRPSRRSLPAPCAAPQRPVQEATQGATVTTLSRGPNGPHKGLAIGIAKALQDTMGEQDAPIQRIAHQIGRSPETVKRWWSGTRQPRGDDLILLMAHFPRVYHAVLGVAAVWSPDPSHIHRELTQ